MTKMNSFIILLVLVVCMILAGCTKSNTESEPIHTEPSAANTPTNKPSESNSNTNQSDLVGSVELENLGTDTKITYTFKNQSETKVTVIGGASYKLLKDNKAVDEGGVPIKDYLDLEPGQEYTDIKIFSKLEPGSYTINVDWNNTLVSAEFIQN
ncbi:hypothetical protein [Candidatus Pristimantibacillus sp. PTI5]|uniref:hypothetical protein n=1 Tax=Candidatus Pristimantibacillus sp. PTI5 TaxID=3400422 RepID=UPI003B02A537